MKRSLILITMAIACLIMTVCLLFSGREYDVSAEENNDVVIASIAPISMAAPHSIEIEENEQTDSDTVTETEIMYYTEEEVVMMAKVLYLECRGVPSDTEKACVAWTVCNRVGLDKFKGDTISEIITAPGQFAYSYNTPVTDELYALSLDVLQRWNAERNGEVYVGRVLPKDYTYYSGDGVHNYFRNNYDGGYSIWDYSLQSPYES